MDRLRQSDFLEHFGGKVFISQFEALAELDPQTTQRASGLRRNGLAGGLHSPHSTTQETDSEKRP
ncbi:hypothetical protein D3C86_2217420 [compost metagenome]